MLEPTNCTVLCVEVNGMRNAQIPHCLCAQEARLMASIPSDSSAARTSNRSTGARQSRKCSSARTFGRTSALMIVARARLLTDQLASSGIRPQPITNVSGVENQLEINRGPQLSPFNRVAQHKKETGDSSRENPAGSFLFHRRLTSLVLRINPAAPYSGASESLRSVYLLWRVLTSGKGFHLHWPHRPNEKQMSQEGPREARGAQLSCGWSRMRRQYALPRCWPRFTNFTRARWRVRAAFGAAL